MIRCQSMTDCLHIHGIRVYGYTGLFPEERALGQWYEVDLTVWMDLSPAGASDRIEDTFNYVNVVQRIQHHIKTKDYALIERLAATIAELVLEDERLEQVRVRLFKVSPPIPDFGGRVSVELTRKRAKRAENQEK